MTSQDRVDWGSLIFRIYKSMHDDKMRRTRSLLIPFSILIFLAFLSGGLSLIHSGHDMFGKLSIVIGAGLMFFIWYRLDRSMMRAEGRASGWVLDVKSLVIGLAMLLIGGLVFLDPGNRIMDGAYPYATVIRSLGFAIAVFGIVWCVASLRG